MQQGNSPARRLDLAPLPDDSIFVIYGRAHKLILSHEADPENGTQWVPKSSGGGKLKLVLSREDEPAQQVHLEYEAYAYQGPVGTEEPASWLFAEFNPTTILTGNNVFPATIADPETGEINEIPSSQPRFLMTAYRMGFHLLEQLAQQAALIKGKLFSRRTWQAIEDGDVHVIRSQWCAYLPSSDVSTFLQVITVLFDQTIAHGKGIIQLASHLGFKCTVFHHPQPTTA